MGILVFAVKHDLHCKASLVARELLTVPSRKLNFSGVVSLCSIWMLMLIAESNAVRTIGFEVENDYLKAYPQEKMYFIAGLEFGPLKEHKMVIVKALNELQSSSLFYHKCSPDTLCNIRFVQCKSDTDMGLTDCGTHHEYV